LCVHEDDAHARLGRDRCALGVKGQRRHVVQDFRAGLGFGKTLDHNLALLEHTSLFHGLGVPLLIGASRKRFIQGLAGGLKPQARDPGSHAAAIAAACQGAQILRVHDVAGTRQALGVWRASVLGLEN
jgi:dihydropteroate synthase